MSISTTLPVQIRTRTVHMDWCILPIRPDLANLRGIETGGFVPKGETRQAAGGGLALTVEQT